MLYSRVFVGFFRYETAPVVCLGCFRRCLTRLPGHGLQPKTVLDHKGTLHFVYLAGDAGGSDVFYTRRNAGES